MPKYRIELDREKCTGDKQCADLAPETFAIDSEDKCYVIDAGGNWPEYILKAARTCPADAITIYDVESGERVWPEP